MPLDPVYIGHLSCNWSSARILESLTALLIGLNMRYKVHGAGIRFTRLPLK